MTDDRAIALIAVIAPTMASIAAMVIGMRNGELSKLRAEATQKTVEKVHVLVDGNLSEVKQQLAASMTQVKQLSELLTSFVNLKALRESDVKDALKRAEDKTQETK